VSLPADDLLDAVAAALAASPPTPPTGSTVTIEVADVPTVDPDKLVKGDLHLWVMWAEYDPGPPLSRGQDTTDVTVTVVAVERYTGAGAVPLDWRRERSAWFHTAVVDVLNDPRNPVGGYYAAESEKVMFDREQLVQKVFWTAFTVVLRGES
jgi:hypothetical protein